MFAIVNGIFDEGIQYEPTFSVTNHKRARKWQNVPRIRAGIELDASIRPLGGQTIASNLRAYVPYS